MDRPLPLTLVTRLRLIIHQEPYGGMTIGPFLSRGDEELMGRGYVERRGNRLLPTPEGVQFMAEVDHG